MSRNNQVALPGAGVLDWSRSLREALDSTITGLQQQQQQASLDKQRKFDRNNIIEDRKLEEEQRLANKNTNEYLAGFHEKDFKFQLDDHGKYVSGLLSDAQTRLDDEVSAVISFIKDPSVPVDQVVDMYRSNIVASGKKGSGVEEDVAKFKTNLEAIRNEFTAENYGQEAYDARLKEIIDAKYGARRQDLINAISTGQGMTKEEKVNAIISRLPDNLRNHMDLNFLREQIGHKVTALSAEQLRKDEADRVGVLKQVGVKNLQDTNKSTRSSSGSRPSGKDKYGSTAYVAAQNSVQDTMNRPQLTIDDIGRNDYNKVLNEMHRLENELVDKDIAAYALRSVIDEGIIDNTLEDKDIESARTLAHNLQKARGGTGEVRGSSSGRSTTSSFTPVTPRSLQELKASLLRMPKRNAYLPALEKYLPSPVTKQVAGNKTPSDLATPADVLGSLLSESKKSTSSPKADGPAEFPAVRDDSFLNVPKNLGAESRAEHEKAARIARYKEGRDMVKAYNNSVGENDITSDTVFVLPYDAEGNDRPWDEIVKDINSRESIGFLDKIRSKRTIERARNNPALQKELIDEANKVISAGIRVSLGGDRLMGFMDKGFSGVGNFFSDVFAGSGDPTSDEYKQELIDRNTERQGWKNSTIGRDNLEQFIHTKMGTEESKTGLLGDLIDYSADTATGDILSYAVPVGAGLGVVKLGARGVKALKNTLYSADKHLKTTTKAFGKATKEADSAAKTFEKAAKTAEKTGKKVDAQKASKAKDKAKDAKKKAEELKKEMDKAKEVVRTTNKGSKKTNPNKDRYKNKDAPKNRSDETLDKAQYRKDLDKQAEFRAKKDRLEKERLDKLRKDILDRDNKLNTAVRDDFKKQAELLEKLVKQQIKPGSKTNPNVGRYNLPKTNPNAGKYLQRKRDAIEELERLLSRKSL